MTPEERTGPTPEELMADPAWQRYARDLAVAICQGKGCFWLEPDAESEALIALWRASLDFEPKREIPFERYLAIRVRGRVLDLMRREYTGGVKCPRSLLAEVPPVRSTSWLKGDPRTPPEPPERHVTGARAVEERDAAEHLARRAGGRLEAEIVLGMVVDGRHARELAERFGYHEGRTYQIRRQVLGELRDQFRRERLLAEADRVA
jgi:DNA-directed RNA polymerase specialized sigma24 family protein